MMGSVYLVLFCVFFSTTFGAPADVAGPWDDILKDCLFYNPVAKEGTVLGVCDSNDTVQNIGNEAAVFRAKLCRNFNILSVDVCINKKDATSESVSHYLDIEFKGKNVCEIVSHMPAAVESDKDYIALLRNATICRSICDGSWEPVCKLTASAQCYVKDCLTEGRPNGGGQGNGTPTPPANGNSQGNGTPAPANGSGQGNGTPPSENGSGQGNGTPLPAHGSGQGNGTPARPATKDNDEDGDTVNQSSTSPPTELPSDSTPSEDWNDDDPQEEYWREVDQDEGEEPNPLEGEEGANKNNAYPSEGEELNPLGGEEEANKNNANPSEGESFDQSGTSLNTKPYDDEPSSSHFLAYFLTAVVICISGYVIYHNKQKIMAFIVEGRSNERGKRQRSKDVKYTQLKSNVEEVIPSLEKTATAKNYVY